MSLDPRLKESLSVGTGRARSAQLALGASAAIGILQIAAYFHQLGLLARARDVDRPAASAYTSSDDLVRGLALLQLTAFILVMVFLLRWLHRSVKNARDLQDTVWLPTPRETVRSFFIPFVNLVKPVEIISNLHRAVWPEQLPTRVRFEADPNAGYRGNATREVVERWTRVSAPIGWWWLFHLLPAAERFFQMGATDLASIEGLTALIRVAIVFSGIRVVADVLGILVVRGIESRATELALRREAAPDDEDDRDEGRADPGATGERLSR